MVGLKGWGDGFVLSVFAHDRIVGAGCFYGQQGYPASEIGLRPTLLVTTMTNKT
jgi:hypothetical protein